jgi:hypothetical protein
MQGFQDAVTTGLRPVPHLCSLFMPRKTARWAVATAEQL